MASAPKTLRAWHRLLKYWVSGEDVVELPVGLLHLENELHRTHLNQLSGGAHDSVADLTGGDVEETRFRSWAS